MDRAACAARGLQVCNVPDYGTEEAAVTAIALALALPRGQQLYHGAMRGADPCAWGVLPSAVVRRLSAQGFGVVGLGRIGTAAALRAKAQGMRVRFFDPLERFPFESAHENRSMTLSWLASLPDHTTPFDRIML